MKQWDRARILDEIAERDHLIQLLMTEEMEQSEAYAPLEIDVTETVDREAKEILRLREEIRTLGAML
jgi:hypothetical protein